MRNLYLSRAVLASFEGEGGAVRALVTPVARVPGPGLARVRAQVPVPAQVPARVPGPGLARAMAASPRRM